ncbi:sphingosine kinase A, B, putative [Trypanosoma cruzi marinkellei]|uniref:Sphingosine kinase A, B, putative n=1 Tax=Trypanosoma cruzi marinkellei TaxID=85056 RepID=K2MU01_TRYCR|nr:sphingosine kinase A, B, putative [Trypanosoma cruzi marinkellei]
MSNGNEGLFSLLSPTNDQNTRQSSEVVSGRVNASASCSFDELSVRVRYRQKDAILKYDRTNEHVFLQRLDKMGQVVNVVKISTWNIVNIETSEERSLRQSRYSKMGTAGGALNKTNRRRLFLNLSKDLPRPLETASRKFGIMSISSSTQMSSHYFSNSGVVPRLLSRSSFGHIHSLDCPGCLYYLYYVKQSGSSLRVFTLEFSPLLDYENKRKMDFLVRSILRSVYPSGTKKLILFVSPKSGSGKAVSITEEKVFPVLYFSRHEMSVVVTTRVFHCEDYIADLANEINSEHVIVTVGGDGMIHEAVNGLFRRKQALLMRDSAGMKQHKGTLHGEEEEEKEKEEEEKVHQKEEDHENMEEDRSENNGLFVMDKYGIIEENETAQITDLEEVRNVGSNASKPFARQVGPEIVSDSRSSLDIQPFSMPLIATIPAGSGCGMAKTLDVSSVKESVLALVHLQRCMKDLMSMQYIRNSEKEKAVASFPHLNVNCAGDKWRADDSKEGEKERVIAERIAFMTVTFGLLNAIDRGSEKLRWMGNARFTAYGAYVFMRGIRSYSARMRYLPWQGREGQQLAKFEKERFLPGEPELPRCTWTNACSHCQANKHCTKSFTTSLGVDGCVISSQGTTGVEPPSILESGSVDFDDDSLPWVKLDGNHYAIFLSNIRDAAKDIMMAPLAHMSDGAIDIVFSREKDGKKSRSDFLKFFTTMETGNHVKLPFVSYIKARAVELEAVEGFIMSDGEMMPFTRVRITPLRRAIEFVRGR